MKKFIATVFSVAALSFAANVQVLPPSGAEFAPDAPNMVQSIVRASVNQTGNTPVEGAAVIQLRTNIMVMGASIIVVCEQVNNGAVVGSGKQKASSIDDLDVAIEGAVKIALADVSGASPNVTNNAPVAQNNASGVVVVTNGDNNKGDNNKGDANDNFAHKRPTRNYVSYGLGAALWHNYDYVDKSCKEEEDPVACHKDNDVDRSWEKAFMFHYARIYEVIPQAAITLVNNMNFTMSDEWQIHETVLLGGRFFPSTGVITPFLGLGAGIGLQFDSHYDFESRAFFAVGLATGVELGVIFFRNSATQLEIGLAWDALWDGLDHYDRRFGAGSAYIAINY